MKFTSRRVKSGDSYKKALKQNIKHRLNVARSKGDENLVEQLEKEVAYLHLK